MPVGGKGWRMTVAEVEPQRRASVALDQITAARQQWQREQRRPRAMSAREALEAITFECEVVWTAAANLRAGVELTPEDFDRLTTSMKLIHEIGAEATR